MNRKLMFVFAVALAILLPMMIVGQEKKGGGKKMDKMEKMEPMAVTGCLNKGADADHFVLKDQDFLCVVADRFFLRVFSLAAARS